MYAKAQILAYNECENYSIQTIHPALYPATQRSLARSRPAYILLSIIIKLPMSTTMGDINGKSTARGRARARCWEPPASAPQIISCLSLSPIFSYSAAHRDPISIVRYYMRRGAPARIYSGAEQARSQLKWDRSSCDSQAPNQ